MANLQSLLRRRPEIDEAEFELVRSKTLSRLTALSHGDPGTAVEELEEGAGESAEGASAEDAETAAMAEPVSGDAQPDGDDSDDRPALVGVMAEQPAATSWNHVVWVVGDETNEASADGAGDPELAGLVATTSSSAPGPRAVVSSIWDESASRAKDADAAPATHRPKRAPAPRATKAASPSPTTAASCPYCALLLDPAPEASRRCTRCRQRIIVKRVQGRAVYLTEASLLVFSAQRRRSASVGRWTRDRDRWLKGAAAVGASETRVARLAHAPLTEDSVRAAQSLYMTTVEKSFRSAKREHRWEDASKIKREQALLLFRFAGSPTPPPEDIVHIHREGATAALRGIGEMAKDAELVHGGTCCGTCRADAGRTYRISHELHVPRLPHADCPRGLCRCDWDLAIRDRDMVRRYLRRRPRSEQAFVEEVLAEEAHEAHEGPDTVEDAEA